MRTEDDIYLFVPSYHRARNLKTVKWFAKLGYDASKIVVFIDSEADDRAEYVEECERLGCKLHIFDMEEARRRYDYVHRPSVSRRSAGQARNMFQDYAKANGIDFYVVQDDDTGNMQIKRFGRHLGTARIEEIRRVFKAVEAMMRRRRIGLFGLSQTGDICGGEEDKCFRAKVMNTSFYLMPYVYRGERGVQDNDTSLFCGIMNEGLFAGSAADGLVLLQTVSVTQRGGLTDLYKECKLLNKSLVVPIQFPSAVWAEKQTMNGNRIHHHIDNKCLFPRIIKVKSGYNLNWDKYPEDVPFTNEPKKRKYGKADEI